MNPAGQALRVLALTACICAQAFAADFCRPLSAAAWTAPSEASRFVYPAIRIGFSKPLLPIGDPAAVAAKLKALPAGERNLFFVALAIDRLPHAHPADALAADAGLTTIWWENGAAAAASRLRRFAMALAGADVAPDFVAFDIEQPRSTWVLGRCPEALAQWQAIAVDPRFRRPVWLDPARSFIAAACRRNDLSFRAHWNRDSRVAVTRYLTSAFAAPVLARFPQAGVSNYDHYAWPANDIVRDLNGHRFQTLAHTDTIVGTHQSPELYGRLHQLRGKVDPGAPKSYFETPFDSLRMALNRLRSAALGSEAPIAPWIARSSFGADGAVPHARTPHWRELVLHAALSGVERILYFNAPTGPTDTAAARTDDDRRMAAALAEFAEERRCDTPVLATTTLLADDERWILTGARLGDRGLWRVTAPFGGSLSTERRDGRLVLTDGRYALDFGRATDVEASVEPGSPGVWIRQRTGYAAPRVAQ